MNVKSTPYQKPTLTSRNRSGLGHAVALVITLIAAIYLGSSIFFWLEPDPANWYEQVPDCPCTIPVTTDQTAQRGDLDAAWSNPKPANAAHPGATWEIRWALQPGQPGQQCTYDQRGVLLTSGEAAGTPDKAAYFERGNLFWKVPTPFSAEGWSNYEHTIKDLLPYIWAKARNDIDGYLASWPPNRGRTDTGQACPPNPGETGNVTTR